MDLLVSQPATVNVILPAASVRQEVTVTSSVQPVLNTTDATLGNAFDGNQIASLPLSQRNVPDLLSLQPGVTFLGRSDDVSGTQGMGNSATDSRAGSVNGGRSDQSNITLDGVDVNDINNGYAFTSVLRIDTGFGGGISRDDQQSQRGGRALVRCAGGPGDAQRIEQRCMARYTNTTARTCWRRMTSSTSSSSLRRVCRIVR